MNYRHQFHAGNFADVLKHAALVQLVRSLQRKDKGFLHIDTHAGRGAYDLATADQGLSLDRKPEWPDGIGRLLPLGANALSPELTDYVNLVRAHDAARRATEVDPDRPSAPLRHYPGSPAIVRALQRPQDRIALYELQATEHALLAADFPAQKHLQVYATDGYGALRAHLPPLERRALVLIDPPFESTEEFSRILTAIREGLRRLPSAVIAIWYPLTARVQSDLFLDALKTLPETPPVHALELSVAGPSAAMAFRGCGLAVINPPWQVAEKFTALAKDLAVHLAQGPGAGAQAQWIVPER